MTSRRTVAIASGAAALALLAATGVITLGISVSQLATSNAALRAQIESLGEVPVAPPVIGETGETGATGPPGTPGEDGEDGTDGQDGTDGKTGARGPGPTTAQLDAAIAAYCATRNDCVGATGATGATGPPGADSTVPGPAGPAGADSTVPGPPGPAGPTCPDDYTLQIVWLVTSEDENGPPTREQAAICQPTPTEGVEP